MRALRRAFAERYKLHLYDYERIDPTNPRQLVSDEALPNVGQPSHTSITVAFTLYTFGGALIYFMARLMHDRDWDRYYHVYYPAAMEYFDVLAVHYTKQLKTLERNLPGSVRELLPFPSTTPAFERWQQLKSSPVVRTEEEQLVSTLLSTLEKVEDLPSKLDPPQS
jgi:hypothetical protein